MEEMNGVGWDSGMLMRWLGGDGVVAGWEDCGDAAGWEDC
jgi:hypothetical protein